MGLVETHFPTGHSEKGPEKQAFVPPYSIVPVCPVCPVGRYLFGGSG